MSGSPVIRTCCPGPNRNLRTEVVMKSWIPCHNRAAALLLISALPPAFAQTTPASQLPAAPPAPTQAATPLTAPSAPMVPLTMDQAVAEAIAHNPALLSAEQNLLS